MLSGIHEDARQHWTVLCSSDTESIQCMRLLKVTDYSRSVNTWAKAASFVVSYGAEA